MRKKLNQDQRTQKRKHFKRNYRRMRAISDQATREFSHSEIGHCIEDKTLSICSLLLTKKKGYPLHIEPNSDPTLFLSDYSMLSTKVFKEMVSTIVVSDIDRNSLEKLLDIEETLLFIRQLTQLITKLNYYKLQNGQWNYYYNLGMTEGIWTGRVSKKMALVNSMCYTYGRRKVLIEQRQKYFKEQLDEITFQINEHIKQAPSSSSSSSIDTNKLTIIVTDLVDKDQYQLRLELERRKHILKFDAKEHQLVETFYQLKPRQTEIHSAKMIWKAIHDEQILRYDITILKNWFTHKTQSTSCTFQDLPLTNINHIFTSLLFDQQLSSTINFVNNATNMADQFIEHLTQQTISTAETIAQRYVEKVNDEKHKILSNRAKFKKPPSVDTIITAIENRQMNMVQRSEYNIDQTLKMIFQTNINSINERLL